MFMETLAAILKVTMAIEMLIQEDNINNMCFHLLCVFALNSIYLLRSHTFCMSIHQIAGKPLV